MLESQKARIYERSRLRAKGVSEEEISKLQDPPFKPAFVNGKRVKDTLESSGMAAVPQFAFRRAG